MAKRLIDISVAVGFLILLLPLSVAVALLIKAGSPGPAIFRQTRIGQDGRPFTLYKFRTMVADAPLRGPALTIGADPRITRVGRLLRRSKLDELPQLVNVLRGEMSLVGPRPEIPEYVALYPPGLRERVLSVRPGITDAASIELIDEARILGATGDPISAYIHVIMPYKLAAYDRYVESNTVWSDFGIIFRTLRRVVRGQRAAEKTQFSA